MNDAIPPANRGSAIDDAGYGTVPAPRTVRLQRLLPGPVERLWSYLTDAGLRRQWLADGEMPPEAGTSFELVWRNDELTDPPGHKPDGFGTEHRMLSRIVEFEPPHRLAFTWNDGEVRFELEPRGDQVLLTIVHSGISDRRNMVMIGAGWHAHVDVLAARLAGAAPAPFWDNWVGLRAVYEGRVPAE